MAEAQAVEAPVAAAVDRPAAAGNRTEVDSRVGFEVELPPRRSTWDWKWPLFAGLLMIFLLAYWKTLPTREFAGQYFGRLDSTPMLLRLGQSGTRLFGDCQLGEPNSSPRQMALLSGTISNGNHFELHGTLEAGKDEQMIYFEGECTNNIDNNMPQVSGRCRRGRQTTDSRFLGRYSRAWCPPSVIQVETRWLPAPGSRR